jgi:hypothetical protein
MHVTGSCQCGAVRYEADIDTTAAIRVCHCTDCQKFTGSAFRVAARAVPGSLKLTAAEPRAYVKVAESGNRVEQFFCGTCGSHLYGSVPGIEPKPYTLRVGSIDQRDQLRPTTQIWTRSRLGWVEQLGALPEHETQ